MNRRAIIFCVLAIRINAGAQVTYSVMSTADTFLATGSLANPSGTNLTGLNFGAVGALFVAPASSTKGEFQSILRFDLSGASNVFNAAYATNGWNISAISLKLTGNNGGVSEQPNNMIFPAINGGSFIIRWLSTNGWAEGTGTPITPTMDGVTYDSLPDLLSVTNLVLSTNVYTPPGDNMPVTCSLPLEANVVAEIKGGGQITFLLSASDDQIGFLFNSHEYGRGNQPLINVTASPIPPILLNGYYTNGGFQINGSGIPNLFYGIEASTNLLEGDWQTLGTVPASDTGVIMFNDANAPGSSRRFYRLAR